MSEKQNEKQIPLDWDMSDEYFTNDNTDERKVRSLEEIANESSYTPDAMNEMVGITVDELDPKFVQTVEDIGRVKEASVGGATMDEISSRLDLDRDYVQLILMTLEGYAEDSIIATAHLVLLG